MVPFYMPGDTKHPVYCAICKHPHNGICEEGMNFLMKVNNEYKNPPKTVSNAYHTEKIECQVCMASGMWRKPIERRSYDKHIASTHVRNRHVVMCFHCDKILRSRKQYMTHMLRDHGCPHQLAVPICLTAPTICYKAGANMGRLKCKEFCPAHLYCSTHSVKKEHWYNIVSVSPEPEEMTGKNETKTFNFPGKKTVNEVLQLSLNKFWCSPSDLAARHPIQVAEYLSDLRL